jgi:solute carrier family 25 (mitochondrial thiamine pyrophosphate transporter), member 19
MQHSVKEIYRHEGIKGYYRGAATSLLQIAPYMGLLFGTYEASRTHIMKTHNASPRVSDFVAGGIAGVVSKCAIFPLDTIRKRLQVQGPTRERYIHKDIPLYSGIIHTLTRILRQEGLKGLYKGLGIALVKSGPSAAVTLWVFEGSIRFWEWVNHRPGKGGTWHD